MRAPTGPCAVCKTRPATRWWADMHARTHGGGQPRCERCILEPQIAHAFGRIRALPGLLIDYAKVRLP